MDPLSFPSSHALSTQEQTQIPPLAINPNQSMGHEATVFSLSKLSEFMDAPIYPPQENMGTDLNAFMADLDPSLNLPQDASPSITTGVETAQRELEVNASLPQVVIGERSAAGPSTVAATLLSQLMAGMDPSTATDEEILSQLSAAHDLVQNLGWKLASMKIDNPLTWRAPWDLQAAERCYFAKCDFQGSSDYDRKTIQGCWKEKETELTGIRAKNPGGLSTCSYAGFRRTLEFYMNNGSKGKNWVMHEYEYFKYVDNKCVLGSANSVGLVFRKIFKNDKCEISNPSTDTANNRDPEADLINSRENIVSHIDCLNAQVGKRQRTDDPKVFPVGSNVWQHFTKVYVEVPKEAKSKKKGSPYKLAYAVCHHCDRVLKAATENGTSSLTRHAEACKNKQSQTSATCGTRPTVSHVNPSTCSSCHGVPSLLAVCGQSS